MSTARKRRPTSRLAGVTYDTYLELRDAPGNRRLRMAYHDGVLEIMSPEFRHDRESRRLLLLVAVYCKAFDVPYEVAGSTTFRKGQLGRPEGMGREPDESFYLGKAAVESVRDKESLDLTTDPPPSLWVEVDNWGSAKSGLPLYAGLGVPEVWRYRPRRRTLWFGRLAGGGYAEIAVSVALPGLTPETVLDLLDEAKVRGLPAWPTWLESEWFPAHRQELIDRATGR